MQLMPKKILTKTLTFGRRSNVRVNFTFIDRKTFIINLIYSSSTENTTDPINVIKIVRLNMQWKLWAVITELVRCLIIIVKNYCQHFCRSFYQI